MPRGDMNHDHIKCSHGIACLTDPNCEVNLSAQLDEATRNGWRWIKGDDFPASTRDDQEKERTAVWGIHEIAGGRIVHGNAIEVYTSGEDRDRIVALLQMPEAGDVYTPIGKCRSCGTPVYTAEGFCGVCGAK